ncbi:hypothetical protein [Bradyrhizobium sp.]|uniref:hypothetical protein n=2 Tax=Bradyrhizobium sp. TaxID=376 RepID=UPI0025C31B91|nr:hypothetical protein [Bradyrhizobium sp.]MBV8916977.1 hypothetical protein [Bradyrhizobium sp.]
MPSDPDAKWRVRLAFLSLFAVFAIGVYFSGQLAKLQEGMAVRQNRTAAQGTSEVKQAAEPLKPRADDKSQPLLAMATKAADETDAAIESLTNEIAPPGIAKTIEFYHAASPGDLEALRRDVKTAETNATTFLPRYVALLKAEHDGLEQYARANADRSTATRLLASLERRQAAITDFASRMLAARADYYRAYDNYVAFLAREYGAFKVDKGQFVFPLQFTYNRYNVVAGAMTAAANRVGELDQEGRILLASQREQLTQSISGK